MMASIHHDAFAELVSAGSGNVGPTHYARQKSWEKPPTTASTFLFHIIYTSKQLVTCRVLPFETCFSSIDRTNGYTSHATHRGRLAFICSYELV